MKDKQISHAIRAWLDTPATQQDVNLLALDLRNFWDTFHPELVDKPITNRTVLKLLQQEFSNYAGGLEKAGEYPIAYIAGMPTINVESLHNDSYILTGAKNLRLIIASLEALADRGETLSQSERSTFQKHAALVQNALPELVKLAGNVALPEMNDPSFAESNDANRRLKAAAQKAAVSFPINIKKAIEGVSRGKGGSGQPRPSDN